MENLITITAAAAQLGVTPRILEWCNHEGLLPLHKAMGQRARLVNLEQAREAVATRRRRGRPRGERHPQAPSSQESPQ